MNHLQKSQLAAMEAAVISNYPKYLHQRDPDTYNFWQSGTKSHFPNGRILHRIPMLALPADTDDTSFIYLTHPDRKDIPALKNTFQTQYPIEQASSSLTPNAYMDLKAYPTFLGKRMVREMDACVICNVLLLMLDQQNSLTRIDLDSIEYLSRVLKRKDHLNAAFEVAPNYANGSIILYHMARLTATHEELDDLQELRKMTIDGLQAQDERQLPFMERLLVHASLLRLGQSAPRLSLNQVESHFEGFYFFQAGMLTGLQKGYLKRLAGNSIFHLRYQCQAYYWTLVFEYLTLHSSYKSSKS